jgi:hypothetical protein
MVNKFQRTGTTKLGKTCFRYKALQVFSNKFLQNMEIQGITNRDLQYSIGK